MITIVPDRIEKDVLLRAPRSRVWKALTRPEEFGAWFGAKVAGPFAVGKRVAGPITHPGYEHLTMEFTVERIEPETLFSFRWHPYAIDPKVDYSKEPTTLVEFRLEDAKEGTKLSVAESGFEGIPEKRRAEAFRMNAQGWEAQMENVRRHVGG